LAVTFYLVPSSQAKKYFPPPPMGVYPLRSFLSFFFSNLTVVADFRILVRQRMRSFESPVWHRGSPSESPPHPFPKPCLTPPQLPPLHLSCMTTLRCPLRKVTAPPCPLPPCRSGCRCGIMHQKLCPLEHLLIRSDVFFADRPSFFFTQRKVRIFGVSSSSIVFLISRFP